MHYHVVFDALRNGSELAICVVLPVLLLVPGIVGWTLIRSRDKNSARKGALFLFSSAVSFVISVVVASIGFVEYHQMKKAGASGDYQVMEAIVSDFIPMPISGHPSESFSVGGVPFRYGAGWDSLVFNATWDRGYIHNGAQVRITHRGIDILRVEVD
jgi:hypothetical protein